MSSRNTILVLHVSLLYGPLLAQRTTIRCDRGPGRGLITTISTTLPYDSAHASALIDPVLRALGYQIDTRTKQPGVRVTLPTSASRRGTEEGSSRADRNVGLQLFVTTRGKGDSTVLNVGAGVLCIEDSQEEEQRPGRTSSSLRVTAAMQVVNEISARLRNP